MLSRQRQLCRTKVAKLKNNCLSRRGKLCRYKEGQGPEKLGANRFGVTTQGIYVSTRTRLLKEIYVATSTKYVVTQIKNKHREKIVTEKREITTEEAIKTGSSVVTYISMSRKRDQFGLEFWGSTMQLMK